MYLLLVLLLYKLYPTFYSTSSIPLPHTLHIDVLYIFYTYTYTYIYHINYYYIIYIPYTHIYLTYILHIRV